MTDTPAQPDSPQLSDQHRGSLRRLGRDTLLYGIASVLSRVVGFVMLPIYTRYLTPSDYGLLAILDLSLEIALLLFSAGASAGLMRFYYKTEDPRERNQVLFTAWASTTALYAVGTVVLLLAAPYIWKHGLHSSGTLEMVRLAAVNFTLSSLLMVPMQMLNIDQRPGTSSIVLTVKLVVQLSLNILFVVGLGLGPIGILWSTFWSSLAIGTVMTIVLLRRTGRAWSWQAFRDLRRFSIPIQVSKAGTFFLAYGDRFFLDKFHGLAVVGLYGLAYQFGFLIASMLTLPFMQAWNPQRFQLAHVDRKRRDAIYNRGFLYGDVVIVGGAVAISLLIRPILNIMTTEAFHPAAAFVPMIVLAYVFQAWANVADFGIEVSEKTKYTSYSTWCSVAVIVVLYVLLVPPLAGMGAAIATMVAMFVRFGATLYFAQRLWPVSYEWGPHVRMVMAGAAVTIGALLVPVTGILSITGVAIAAFGLYALWVWAMVLHADDRSAMLTLVRSPRSFKDLLKAE